MKVLILTGKFGMGHWSASESLRRQLLEEFDGLDIQIIDLLDYALPGVSEAVYLGFRLLVTHGTPLFNTFYRATENNLGGAPSLWDVLLPDKLKELLAQEAPEAVISTHPICAQFMAQYKNEQGSTIPLITCVTDITTHSEWICPGTDCYLVGSSEIKANFVHKGVPRERVLVTGIPVGPEFKRCDFSRGGEERHLLIMGGGMGLLPKKEQFYEALNSLPHVRTTIITGGNKKLEERLRGKYENIEVVGYTDRVYDYMARADLLLSKPGGITLFETIFSQLPILTWEPFLQQEKNNAQFLLTAGIGRVAAKEPEACLGAIRDLIYDRQALYQMSQNMRALRGQLEEEGLFGLFASLQQGVCA